MALLSIRPDYEIATRYGSAWLTLVLNAASNKGMSYVDLYKENATETNFFSNLNKADLIHIFGHGNYNLITCQNSRNLLISCQNDGALAEKIVYNLSCRAGRGLGDSAISKGCISFLGYQEDFIFLITRGNHPDGGMTNPLQDEASRGFFESHNAAPISFIQKANLSQSYSDSQNKFNYWIKVWEAIDAQVVALLIWDRDNQVMKPFVPIILPARSPIPLIMMASLLLLLPTKDLKKTNSLFKYGK